MTRIVQIVPFMRPGLGIPGVVWNLDREFRALGVDTEVFTFDAARRGVPFSYPRHGIARRVATIRRVLWFRFVGSRRAREYLAERPDAVAICHNEALAGDIFVHHGSTIRALRAARTPWRKIILNPSQSIGYLHDRRRFRGRVHRVVVTLTSEGHNDLKLLFGKVQPRVVTIPNGVDLSRFAPATLESRDSLRSEFGLGNEDRVALFVGHDLAGKGIEYAVGALAYAPTVLLLVIGGDEVTIASSRDHARRLGVEDRVLLIGAQPDVERYFGIADMFVFPSGYEAFGLVTLEALASGVPVVATRVGIAPEIVRDGVNGYLVARDEQEIGDRMELLAAADFELVRDNARSSVKEYSWTSVARKYLALAEQVLAERKSP